jgi:metal-sulfur cluster biosynthetic enzyme
MRETDVLDVLREVVDPELGINVVDLGMVYRVDCGPSHVRVDLTMTTSTCPMAKQIAEDARAAVQKHFPEVLVAVELVWAPPWDPSRMSPAAKKELGWSD